MTSEAIAWLLKNVRLQTVNSVELLYDHVPSQSGRALPVVYLEFDGRREPHFVDRGRILDFALSAGPGSVLDFGPGDGWPSLPMAGLVREVTGVDGSARRVAECAANAIRLGIANARFVHAPPGSPLPFGDATFDGATAASSVEQSPDPRESLREIGRVLKPGGKLRLAYESLPPYREGREQELVVWPVEAQRTLLILYDRRPAEERVIQYRLDLAIPRNKVRDTFQRHGTEVTFAGLTPAVLANLCAHLTGAAVCTTRHPSCRTLLGWLVEVGFGSARTTDSGGRAATRLFASLPEPQHPQDLAGTDRLLKPAVQEAIEKPVPETGETGGPEPMITAVK